MHMCYSSQIVLFDSMFESITFFSWPRQAVPNRGTNLRNCFFSHGCLAKKIFKIREVISCTYPAMWDKFKYFIQIIRTIVIDIVCML